MPAGRNVWEDRNTFGKSHQIHLARLRSALCLGVIASLSWDAQPPTASPPRTSARRATRLRSSSRCWLLDESKMTPEVRKFVEKHGSDTSLTTREWESYVPQALREFDIQERGVGGGIPEEKSDDGKDNESQDDLSLGNIPSLMPWDDPYEAPTKQ
jgi:hypothetical protein